MEWLSGLPFWATFLLVFGFRAVDVSLGTLRTISVVNGRLSLAVGLAFVEVILWAIALGELMHRLGEQPSLILAFAGGVAAGNALGMTIERRLALGTCVVRMIASHKGHEIAEAIRTIGRAATTFEGRGRDGPRTLIYSHCHRRDLPRLLAAARALEPAVFYAVEPASSGRALTALVSPGWRSPLKKG